MGDIVESAIITIGAVIFGSFLIVTVLVWPTMLLFGVVHSFLPIIPAFSFWQTAAILLLMRFIFPSSPISKD